MSLAQRLEAVERAPAGRRVAAYFDFDGTLIDGFSAVAVMRERARRGHIGATEVANLAVLAAKGAAGRSDFEELMRVSVRSLAGRSVAELNALGEHLARSALGGALFGEATALVSAHQARGHAVAVASSALPFQVEPLARELGIDTVLCTRAGAEDGTHLGTVDGPILWGPPKAAAVRAHARRRKVRLRESFGYANGAEDIEFLSAVGLPCAVNPGETLQRAARERGWPVERWSRPRSGLEEVLRTSCSVTSLALAQALGLGAGLLSGRWRGAARLAHTAGTEVALGLAGVDVEASGIEHLVSAAPCVAVYNHRSALDRLIMTRLTAGRALVAAPQAELAAAALTGASLAGAPADLTAGEGELLAVLRSGRSVAVAPEGERSITRSIGAFDAMPFHVARRAGVPVVPVAIHDAGELMWRGARAVRRGTVRVTVLEPIASDGWRAADVPDHAEDVRRAIADALRRQPAQLTGPATST